MSWPTVTQAALQKMTAGTGHAAISGLSIPIDALIFVIINDIGTNAGGTLTDSNSVSYNLTTSLDWTSGELQFFESTGPASAAVTSITYTNSSSGYSNVEAAVLYVTGGFRLGSDPFDSACSSASSATTSGATASITVSGMSVAGELVLVGFSEIDALPATYSTGWTGSYDAGIILGYAYKVFPTTASSVLTVSNLTAGDTYAYAFAGFIPGTAATGFNMPMLGM